MPSFLLIIFLVSVLVGFDFKTPRFVVEAACLFVFCAVALFLGVNDTSLWGLLPIPFFWNLLVIVGFVVALGFSIGLATDFFWCHHVASAQQKKESVEVVAKVETFPHHHP